MQVFLDDIALDAPNTSLSAALEAVSATAQAQGRIVVEVLCDGLPASEQALRGAAETHPAELRCRSANPSELILSTLDNAAAELDLLIPDQRAAAEKLWIGNLDAAMHDLRAILERWRVIREALEQCALAAGLSLESIGRAQGSASAQVAALARDLEQVRNELAAGRTIELADLLGTDLCNRARGWRDMFADFAKLLAPLGAGEATP